MNSSPLVSFATRHENAVRERKKRTRTRRRDEDVLNKGMRVKSFSPLERGTFRPGGEKKNIVMTDHQLSTLDFNDGNIVGALHRPIAAWRLHFWIFTLIYKQKSFLWFIPRPNNQLQGRSSVTSSSLI